MGICDRHPLTTPYHKEVTDVSICGYLKDRGPGVTLEAPARKWLGRRIDAANRPVLRDLSYSPPILCAGLFLVQKSGLNLKWPLTVIFGAKPVSLISS